MLKQGCRASSNLYRSLRTHAVIYRIVIYQENLTETILHAGQGCSCDRNLLQQAAQRGVGNNAIRISVFLALPSRLQSNDVTIIHE